MAKRLEVNHVSFSYENNLQVLDDISLDAGEGDFVVLLGASGCGKTTLLNIIAGLTTISEGEICIDGVKCNDLDPKDRDIAMIFQNYALYPTLTVYENIAFPLKNAGYKKQQIDKIVRDTANALNISDFLRKKPAKLSGGQKQRVAIARAIVRKPKIFLMDEPLSNLDASLRNQMRQEIKNLHQKLNATIIYVTHDQIEALSLATKIIVMNNGKVQQIGTPKEIYVYPHNEFVATFLGTPKMNIINGIRPIIECGHFHFNIFSEEYIIETPNLSSIPSALDIGIRPDDIEVIPCDNVTDYRVKGKEYLGESFIYYCECIETGLITLVKSDKDIPNGQYIELKCMQAKIHFFDEKTKEAIMV